jgi:hypothetical protein
MKNNQDKRTANKQEKENHGRLTPERGWVNLLTFSPAHKSAGQPDSCGHQKLFKVWGTANNITIGHNKTSIIERGW